MCAGERIASRAAFQARGVSGAGARGELTRPSGQRHNLRANLKARSPMCASEQVSRAASAMGTSSEREEGAASASLASDFHRQER
ncbi:hypothetical protein [Paenibacillus sp. TC-CSREp1]|uniref:hypothetical protein n=1 Tax=Paenibacillus sp. TC-CSREp1 TaxID=3410089 RepID=UPI003CF0B8C7